MEILVDENNILSIENPNIPKNKEYYYNVSGYTFSDFDKCISFSLKKELENRGYEICFKNYQSLKVF